jgi:spermidine synthase
MISFFLRRFDLRTIVIILFTLSGISGLIYEIAWSKYLATFIGSTAYSQMIVLATFMGGLAAGAFFWGKLADKTSNLLKLYAILEIVIGVYCFGFPFFLSLLEKIFVGIAISGDIISNSVLLLLLKFLLSVTLLVLPTFLMGGTLPVLTKLFTKKITDAGKDVATFYFINSLGAVLGAAIGGFFLIRLYSLDSAVWIAASVNSVVGITALLFSKNISVKLSTEKDQVIVKQENIYQFPKRQITIAVTTAGITGFVAMLYELAWTRLLANTLGSSTYSFTLMLIAFISGITLGSWIISVVIKKVKNLFVLLGFCQFGTAVFMLITLQIGRAHV